MTDIRTPASDADVNSVPPAPEWMLDCRFVEESAASFALGALDPDERIRLTFHISWCPACAALVHETRKTAGYLPFTAPQAAPPARVKARLFDRIAAARTAGPIAFVDSSFQTITLPASTLAPDVSAASQNHGATAPLKPRSPAHTSRRRPRWELIVAPLAALPFVVALAIVGGWALHTQTELREAIAQKEDAEELAADLADRIPVVNMPLDSDLTQSYELASNESQVGGRAAGELTAVLDKPIAFLEVWNLPANFASYEVFVETTDGRWYRAGEFDVDSTGTNRNISLVIDEPITAYRSLHVRPVPTTDSMPANDSLTPVDVLWLDLDSGLGVPGGTEANANAR